MDSLRDDWTVVKMDLRRAQMMVHLMESPKVGLNRSSKVQMMADLMVGLMAHRRGA